MSGKRKKWLQEQFHAKYGRYPRRSRQRGQGMRGRWYLGDRLGVDEIRQLKRLWRVYLEGGRRGAFTT